MQGRAIKLTWSRLGHGLLFYLLVFQDALTKAVPFVRYVDEAVAILGIVVIASRSLKKGKLRLTKGTAWMTLLCVLFVAVGLLSNVIYRYQPWPVIMEDVLINIKFFLAIIAGFVLFDGFGMEALADRFSRYARVAAALLFGLFVIDALFGVYPDASYRYGIRVFKLFYRHSTYLAAAAVFLIAVLTMFPRKGNGWFIAMGLILLVFTLRSKAIVAAACYVFIYILTIAWKKKLNFWYFALIGCMAIALAWEQIFYYFIELEGAGARSVLTQTSLRIMGDYFPIGTGFGTFASNVAGEHYSPVYALYGINNIWGMSEENPLFISDTFWPIIFGQTGLLGTAFFVGILAILAVQIFKLRRINRYVYAAGIFVLGYLLISSTSEAAFHNALAIPLAMLLGVMFALRKRHYAGQESAADRYI